MFSALKKLFDTNEKELRRLREQTAEVNNLREGIKALSDEELRAKTPYFKQRLEQGESLDDILPEAFAVVREAAWRTVEMEHFDEQVMGGVFCTRARFEMKTGEGRLWLQRCGLSQSLAGRGVHVITVNDYLANAM